MFKKLSAVYLIATLGIIVVTPGQAAVQRAFVASYGLNSNTSFDCDVAHPCRQFLAAVTVVNPDGEVVALDTAAYGAVTLTQSISLTAAPGAYAGITVFPGSNGVTIATPGVNVVLRGLTINGQGGTNGILMTAGAKLSIENCVISNFNAGAQHGVFVNTAATVRMVNTLIRDSDVGIEFQGGATADISGSKFLGNISNGIFANNTNSSTTTVAISDTVVTGGGVGIEAFSTAGNSRINMIRSAVTNTTEGIAASASGGAASVTLSDSMVTGNTTGYFQSSGGTIRSLVNNIITDNGGNTGVLTTLAPL
ncbi:right-handed parallel beta-helix repeat-containing protein [Candidatus Nitrotoga sp. AM1P]|uniref:right-handed parallel beta-helix repeat-containing protein n=1 Tax=Candidatus Nitrotoga sp. AM1P TaxID=2559597 RepID=UPI0010B10631|nr:right-handed parallel beta-helix repeat-containing protein [Candidatus Nitrotoga sp. AM1P]BBJ22923.1 hypothetical protein W01_08500 [Candidatus Nitrotoga sp. AM1P]